MLLHKIETREFSNTKVKLISSFKKFKKLLVFILLLFTFKYFVSSLNLIIALLNKGKDAVLSIFKESSYMNTF